MALATYAATVNSRSSMTKRTQSLSKISSLGLGVIYYWHWGWASVPEDQYGRYTKSDMEKAAKGLPSSEFKTSGNVEQDSLYGRFMYLGLTVQNPTLTRMKAHVDDAKKSKGEGTNSKANALYQAITASETKYGEKGVINPLSIPNVIHLVSWFDLDALEGYYIGTKYKLGNNPAQSFAEQVQGGNFAEGIGDGITRGVNTAGGGQGGTFKQTNDRGPAEWISAAYYFLKEQDADVLAARSAAGLSGIAETANQKPTLAEKILSVFEGFMNKKVMNSENKKSNLLVPSIIRMMSYYSLDFIQKFLDIVGFKDDSKFAQVKDTEYLNDAQIKEQLDLGGFSVKEFMDINKAGIMLDTMVSYDTKDKKSTSVVSFIGEKGVQTELRTAVINKITQYNSRTRKFIGSNKEIIANIEFSFKNGMDKTEELLALLKAQHDRISKQNREISSSYNLAYRELQSFNGVKGLEELIRKAAEEAKKEAKKIFLEAGIESSMEGVVEYLLIAKKVGVAPKTEKDSKSLGNKLKNKFKVSSSKKLASINEKGAEKLIDALKSVYSRFAILQELIGKVAKLQIKEIENNAVLFVKTDKGKDRELFRIKKP